MKNIFKYLLLGVLVCGVTSCEDFLSPEAVGQIMTDTYYTNDDEVESAVTAIYYTLRVAAVGSTYTSAFNGFSDEDYHGASATDSPINFTATATNSNVTAFWTQLYAGLKNIAFLLEGLENNKNSLSDTTYKNAKGEALFLRGYYHFLLAQWFCRPETGIPMYLSTISSYEDASVPLTNLNGVYTQIEEDMKAAEELLLETGQTWTSLGYSERVTITAVQGILARVALHAAGHPNYGGSVYGGPGQEYYYKLAKEYAEKVIDSNEHTLTSEYSEAFIAPTQDLYVSENIWEVGYYYGGTSTSDVNIGGTVGQGFGLGRSRTDLITGSTIYDSLIVSNSRYMHPRLYASYELGDDRRMWNYATFKYQTYSLTKTPKTITESTYTESAPAGMGGGIKGTSGANSKPAYSLPVAWMWGIQPGKWRREYEARVTRDANSTTTNFPLLRYADVLLMAAEACIELGDTENMNLAVDYINQVRHRAIPSVYETQTGAIAYIISDGTNVNGYGYMPEIKVSGGNGTGFELYADVEYWNYYGYGSLYVGVSNIGYGYTTSPTITVDGLRVITWQPDTNYTIGDHVTVASSATNTSSMRMFRATTSGNSGDTYPTDLTDISTPGTSTVSWTLRSSSTTWTANSSGPTFRAVVNTTGIRSLSAANQELVNITSQEDMRDFVRDERRRELCFENLRRLDLRRWNLLYERVSKMSDDVDGLTAGVISAGNSATGTTHLVNTASNITQYNADYLPIPQTQLTLNTNLVQNPGY